jgi:hypothetical protein
MAEPQRTRRIEIPTLVLVAATRGMLGFGLGLLVSGRLRPRQRRTVGWTLFVIGAASTIPLAVRLLRRPTNHEPARRRRSATAIMGG